MQLRHELVGSEGRIVTDSSVGPVWGFVGKPVGYTVEKADAETGWVYPVPEETRAYGFSQQMRHFVDCLAGGKTPSETYEDGVIVNRIIDACYRSMETKQWGKGCGGLMIGIEGQPAPCSRILPNPCGSRPRRRSRGRLPRVSSPRAAGCRRNAIC